VTTTNGNVLDGVSATTLWTLHNRGTEAMRRDGVLTDPRAVQLLNAISYDYRRSGKPNQSHALRARVFDAATANYLRTHPRAAAVALAEPSITLLEFG
jgi:O-methyltransferase involved in polyketide biosynthesis